VPRFFVPAWPLWRDLRRPTPSKMLTVGLAMLPHGWIDVPGHLTHLGGLLSAWPERDLWITAVRSRDARRTVFGREQVVATPGEAIAASCAIPGLFRPVTIDRRRYIDGGAHSPTNADVLVTAGVDAAIVLSPMSAGSDALGMRPDHLVRTFFRRRLQAECDVLTRAGIAVHVLEPDAATLSSTGVNALDNGRGPRVVRDAFLMAGARIASDGELSELLRTKARRV